MALGKPTLAIRGDSLELIVDGQLEGIIAHHDKHLTVGKHGRVHGQVEANTVTVLGQVFGEETPPKPAPPVQGEAGSTGGSGFSFDEFFGGGQKPAPRPSSGGSRADDGDDDSFREWLKGRKK